MSVSIARFFAAGAIACGPAASFALDYAESRDFYGAIQVEDPLAVLIGTLDSGSNFVRGSLQGHCAAGSCNPLPSFQLPPRDYQDSFTFSVPDGLRVDSITITTDAQGPAGFRPAVETRPASTPYGLFPYYLMPSSGTSENILSQPLASGMHHFSIWGGPADADGLYQVTYTVNFTASAVPEPSTTCLIAVGGLLLLASRRGSRKR